MFVAKIYTENCVAARTWASTTQICTITGRYQHSLSAITELMILFGAAQFAKKKLYCFITLTFSYVKALHTLACKNSKEQIWQSFTHHHGRTVERAV
ncbi:hypothetical protein [Erwinia mallotivora]|uniref:hypothetical protein n=1 Tax=Erwinia mallotivora TaxID=69222 RepID=UPI0021C10334|nr:hypothetical protein [Erwinia mallotivora]